MATQSRDTLKTYFQTGDRPNQTQFYSLIDSTRSAVRNVNHQTNGRWEALNITKILSKPSWITSQSDDGPFFPSLLNTSPLSSPSASWYLYYSTDHSGSNGGIGYACTDDPLGTWTDKGKLFDDTLASLTGNQAETPDVLPIFDDDGSFLRLSMLGHCANMTGAKGSQSTWECTSTDGVTWSVNTDSDLPGVGIVIDPKETVGNFRQLGDGHSGYARRIVYSGMELAFHLDGGTALGYHGISARKYGSTKRFQPLARYYPGGFNAYVGQTAQATCGPLVPFVFRGALYALGHITPSTPASPGTASVADVYIFKVDPYTFMPHSPQIFLPKDSLSDMTYAVRYGSVLNMEDDFIYVTFYGYDNSAKLNQCIGICQGVLH